VEQLPLQTGRPRLVVIGTGWGGARLLHDIDPKLYDLTVISQRNHMVFTPLLASTTVGTIDPRSVTVPVTDIQRALFQPQNSLFIAEATAVHPDRKVVEARADDGQSFLVPYDKLVLATGSQGSTFGIPGVLQHTHFLRDVHQAEAIRARLIDNVARAGIPGRSQEEWQRLLHIVIVGGGPTGVEVAGELTDLINQDLKRLYPDRARAMRVTVVEAREVLGSFDASLREYAARKLIRSGVNLRKGMVKQVTEHEVTLTDGTVLPYGLCIWSTGVGPTPFTQSLPFAKTKVGRLAVDKYLRILAPPNGKPQAAPNGVNGKGEGGTPDAAGGAPAGSEDNTKKVSLLVDESGTPSPTTMQVVPDIYALGDCCANPDNPLPALAQVAEQQGKYLARVLNEQLRARDNGKQGAPAPVHASPTPEEFVYKSLGSMATVGGYSGVLELAQGGSSRLSLAGIVSWLAWRSAYLTRLGSVQKRLLVAFNWTATLLFGRDLSRW